MLGAQLRDVGERVRIGRVVRVHQNVCGGELGAVLENGGLEFAELFENEGALLAAGQFHAVDGCSGLDRWMICWAEGA